jgi:hypothetical protein
MGGVVERIPRRLRTLLQAVAWVAVSLVGIVAFFFLLLLANLLIFHVPLSTR